MANTPVASDVHEPLDVHGHLRAKSAFDLEAPLDGPPEAVDVVVGQILRPPGRIHATGVDNLLGPGPSDPVDVRQSDLDPLPARKIDTCYSCHVLPQP